MRILRSIFHRFMDFCCRPLELGLRQCAHCQTSPRHFLKVNSLVVRCVFCEEAPQAQAARCQGSSEPGVMLLGSERSDAASEQDSARELNACHYNTTASVFAEIRSAPFLLSLRLIK